MKRLWLATALAMIFLAGAVAAWLMTPRFAPPPSAAERSAPMAATAECSADDEAATRSAALIGKARAAGDPMAAERLLQEALAVARTDEQRFAAHEWRAELFDGRDDARQHAAGQAMRAVAQTERQRAAAWHVMARASEGLGDYRAAAEEYREAAVSYRKADQIPMAWLDYATAARLLTERLRRDVAGEALWREAWQTVETAAMPPDEKAAAFYSLCLDRAEAAARRQEYREELHWHRIAADWQPSHAAIAEALERAYRRQRKI